RGVFRPDLALKGKVGKRQFWVGAELDTSFGHVKLDLMTPPQKEADIGVLAYCLDTLLTELKEQEMASVFSMVAADWDLSSQVYSTCNFKVSARLTDHYIENDEYQGVQLWHRRIAASANPRLPSFI